MVAESPIPPELKEKIDFDPALIPLGQEIRAARLYTEFTVGGRTISIEARGARSCSPNAAVLDGSRSTLAYELTCDLTYFHAAESPVGPVTVIDDPRREIVGRILLRRNREGRFNLPGLNYFNQYLIFHVGEHFFYYPSPWQVVSPLTAWPPEYHQYHHLEDDTPIFDFNTREPNVARKGVSTISIEGPLSEKEEHEIRRRHAEEVEVIRRQPGYRVPPEEFLNPDFKV